MTDCKRDREEITAYVDGELTGGARAELESHLSSCERCSAELAAHQRLLEAFATLPEVTPPGDFEARFWARVAREKEAPVSVWRRFLGWGGALTLAAAAAAALVLLLPLAPRSPDEGGGLVEQVLPAAVAKVKVDPDVKIVSNPKDFDLLQDPDMDAISEVDVLEDWDEAGPPS